MTELKTVAIYSGGDWTDASCVHVAVPKDMDLKKAYQEYNDWYQNEYSIKYKLGARPKYFNFNEWLVEFRGASTQHNVEKFEI